MKILNHVVMVPLATYGHMTPLVELAKKLLDDRHITFLIPEYLANDMVARGLTIEHERFTIKALPDGYQALPDTQLTDIVNVYRMMMAYIPVLARFLSTLEKADGTPDIDAPTVNAVIIDVYISKLAASCVAQQIPVYQFNTSAAGGMLLKGLCINESAATYAVKNKEYPLWEDPSDGMEPQPDLEKSIYIDMKNHIPHAAGFIVNSCEALEENAMKKIRSHPLMIGKRVFMVGPLLSDHSSSSKSRDVVDWLDRHDVSSVVYVAFGTHAEPHPEQLVEIFNGLIATKRPFIFSLPKVLQKHLPDHVVEGIEKQFENNLRFVIVSWAPQRTILSHPSTGLFLSHCGWNSTVETMSSGVPVLAWPMFGDQGVNARLMEQHGVAVVVEGTGAKPKRTVRSEEVRELVERMFDSDERRERAGEWRDVLRRATDVDGESRKQLDELIRDGL